MGVLSTVQADIGPAIGRGRVAVHRQARELEELAKLAGEYSAGGTRHDLALAERQFEKMRQILGVSDHG